MSDLLSSFPKLVHRTQITTHESKKDAGLYDVKFCPYELDGYQIFAVAGSSQVLVCRLKEMEDKSYETLFWWNDTRHDTIVNSVAWIADTDGTPLLCAAGADPRHILLLNVKEQRIARTLIGHGRNVNDLVVSSKNILASCSEDFTIRLWDIKYKEQPCIAILAGQGHRQPLLTCCFHPNGNWILSGAMDTAVALWKVPTVTRERETDIDEPVLVLYPHFFSTEIHHDYVDCVAFYGDLIISRCSQKQIENPPANEPNEILIWRIDGFNANDEQGELDNATHLDTAMPGNDTRSAFSGGFQRLLTLSMPNTSRFYLRFGLFHSPGLRPILCMGNAYAEFSFWDLQMLEEPYKINAHKKSRKNELREGSVMSTASRDTGSSVSSTTVASVLEDPFALIKPHNQVKVKVSPNNYFASCAVGWSPDGRWAVSAGDKGNLVIMYRDTVT